MKANVLIQGPIGSGKTHSLRTIVDAGQELFVIALEPGITSILGDISCARGCHWAYIPPASVSWETVRDNLQRLNAYSMDALVKQQAMHKQDYAQLLEVYDCLANFKCQRCGEEFGDVASWEANRTIAIDGLTGLSTMAMHLVVGAKIIKSQPEWYGAQQALQATIEKLCNDTKCNFVLIAHSERERDELTGKNNVTVSTIGVKLAPRLLRPFDEVICARRESDNKGTKFLWSTIEPDVELKTRLLEWSDSIEPDFQLIFDAMKNKEELANA